ncbi:MAG: AAA family ATPase [Dechloromonas sp.]|nr:AAA family ATPase [Dechloromonas sp.]
MFDLSDILVPAQYRVCDAFGWPEVDPAIVVDGYAIPDPATLEDPDAANLAAFLWSAVPPIDPLYRHRKEVVRAIRDWLSEPDGSVLNLWGPTGTGKTTGFEQYCAVTGTPLFSAKGHRRFEPHEAFGQFVGGENGVTPWVDGPVTMAARYGVPCIINEYDRIDPSRTIVFNDVFEGRSFPIPGRAGEVVTPRPGFRCVITANTNLVEDVSGNYGTANSHDVSLLERLYGVQVGYPEPQVEIEMLRGVLADFGDDVMQYWFDQEGLTVSTDAGMKSGSAISREEFVSGLVKVANIVRDHSKDGGNATDAGLERTMSTRTLRRWARHAVLNAELPEREGVSALHASLKRVLTSMATQSTGIAIHQAVTTVFGVDEKVE